MKIAVCLYGMTPFETKMYNNDQPYSQPIEEAYKVDGKSFHSLKSWKANIIDVNDVDFFLHSWSSNVDHQRKLINVFNPKAYKFEEVIYRDSVISSSLSTKKVSSLLDDYEKENLFSYDLVLLCRMDIVWFAPLKIAEVFDSRKFTVTFWGDVDLDKNKTWNVPYEGNKYGTHDVIFASNSKNMKIYATLFDKIDEYRAAETYLSSHHTIKRHHIEKTNLIDIIDHKLIVNKDLEIESRCFLSNQNFVDYLSSHRPPLSNAEF